MTDKIRASVYIEPELWMMAHKDGISFTSLLNDTLATIYNLPPDSTRELLKTQTEKAQLRYRAMYSEKMIIRAEEKEARDKILNAPKERLKIIGGHINSSKHNGRLIESLKNRDFDEDLWDRACTEINKKNKTHYKGLALFNEGINWFKTLGGGATA